MLVHRRSLPCNLFGVLNNSLVPIFTLGCDSEVSCLRAQPSVPNQGLNPDCFIGDERTNHEAIAPVASKGSEMFSSLQPVLYPCVIVFFGEYPLFD